MYKYTLFVLEIAILNHIHCDSIIITQSTGSMKKVYCYDGE